jgi:hypothetical protein
MGGGCEGTKHQVMACIRPDQDILLPLLCHLVAGKPALGPACLQQTCSTTCTPQHTTCWPHHRLPPCCMLDPLCPWSTCLPPLPHPSPPHPPVPPPRSSPPHPAAPAQLGWPPTAQHSSGQQLGHAGRPAAPHAPVVQCVRAGHRQQHDQENSEHRVPVTMIA